MISPSNPLPTVEELRRELNELATLRHERQSLHESNGRCLERARKAEALVAELRAEAVMLRRNFDQAIVMLAHTTRGREK